MLALIIAGGKGSRLQMGEKGLVRLCQKPLISYVSDALKSAGMEPVVLTTSHTPYTANYCRALGITHICTRGAGYIEDIIEAVTILEEKGPVLTICVDIPGITKEHLEEILYQYKNSGNEACSIWIPSGLCPDTLNKKQYKINISGSPAIPAGINILLGEKINNAQTELKILIADPLLSFNINTREELNAAEIAFTKKPSDSVRYNIST